MSSSSSSSVSSSSSSAHASTSTSSRKRKHEKKVVRFNPDSCYVEVTDLPCIQNHQGCVKHYKYQCDSDNDDDELDDLRCPQCVEADKACHQCNSHSVDGGGREYSKRKVPLLEMDESKLPQEDQETIRRFKLLMQRRLEHAKAFDEYEEGLVSENAGSMEEALGPAGGLHVGINYRPILPPTIQKFVEKAQEFERVRVKQYLYWTGETLKSFHEKCEREMNIEPWEKTFKSGFPHYYGMPSIVAGVMATKQKFDELEEEEDEDDE